MLKIRKCENGIGLTKKNYSILVMFHPNLGQVKSLNFPKDEPLQMMTFCQLWGQVRFRLTLFH